MDATPEQFAEGLAIVRVLAAVLDRLVCANSQLALTDPGQVTKFHALKAPGIAILQYLERIHKYASCSNECFILALIYVDRLIQRNNFLLTELNVHRVIITAILLAAKFFDDAYYNNAYYAKVGGVLVSEMNGLEVDFLFRINFSLHVTPDLFDKYRAELISHSVSASLMPPPTPLDMGSSRMASPLVQPTLCAPPIPQNSIVGVAPLNQACPTSHIRDSVMPSQITPSPPHGIRAMPPPPHVTSGATDNLLVSNQLFDPLFVGAGNRSFSADFLQCVASMPPQVHKLGACSFPLPQQNRQCSPHLHFSQPSLPVMHMNGCHLIPVPNRIPSNEQHYVVVDNRVYQIPANLTQFNAAVDASFGDRGAGYHHLCPTTLQQQQQQRRHTEQELMAADGLVVGSVSSQLYSGQIITGMSGL